MPEPPPNRWAGGRVGVDFADGAYGGVRSDISEPTTVWTYAKPELGFSNTDRYPE